jgi:hypothetical protein
MLSLQFMIHNTVYNSSILAFLWMRSIVEWTDRLTACSAEVAIVLGSIQASLYTVESEGGADETMWNKVPEKIQKYPPLYVSSIFTILGTTETGLQRPWMLFCNHQTATSVFCLGNFYVISIF